MRIRLEENKGIPASLLWMLAVISADPDQIFGDMTDTMHIEKPSFW